MNEKEIWEAAEEYAAKAMRLRQLRKEQLQEFSINYDAFIAGVEWCLKNITGNDKERYN